MNPDFGAIWYLGLEDGEPCAEIFDVKGVFAAFNFLK
jgi:hypothetical protein